MKFLIVDNHSAKGEFSRAVTYELTAFSFWVIFGKIITYEYTNRKFVFAYSQN